MSQNIKNLSITFTKADCYTIKANGEWAEFYIDEWGSGGFSLSIRSSFGNWAHGWGSLGGTYVDFIKDLDAYYLASKFSAAKDWDEDVFVKNIKRKIIQYRRDESITKETARQAWNELLEAVSHAGDKNEIFRQLYYNSESGFYSDSEMFDCGEVPNRQFTAFFKLFWPLFIHAIKERKDRPELWGHPTATTAVDKRTIHVGDLCQEFEDGNPRLGPFTVVFEDNMMRCDYGLDVQPYGATLKLPFLSDNARVYNFTYTILKKYNAE